MSDSSPFKSEIVACIHHGNLARLNTHLDKHRIDLPGQEHKTPTGHSSLEWFQRTMKLKVGDRIRIVVDGDVVAFATIFGWPYELPKGQATPLYESTVNLIKINTLKPPYPQASCHCLRVSASHRFDGPKTSQLDRQEYLDR